MAARARRDYTVSLPASKPEMLWLGAARRRAVSIWSVDGAARAFCDQQHLTAEGDGNHHRGEETRTEERPDKAGEAISAQAVAERGGAEVDGVAAGVHHPKSI